jgi:hypothetical protein
MILPVVQGEFEVECSCMIVSIAMVMAVDLDYGFFYSPSDHVVRAGRWLTYWATLRVIQSLEGTSPSFVEIVASWN